jgi:hypothetical protein
MALNVINQSGGATVKFSAITKIRKYKGLFHEGHHFRLLG